MWGHSQAIPCHVWWVCSLATGTWASAHLSVTPRPHHCISAGIPRFPCHGNSRKFTDKHGNGAFQNSRKFMEIHGNQNLPKSWKSSKITEKYGIVNLPKSWKTTEIGQFCKKNLQFMAKFCRQVEHKFYQPKDEFYHRKCHGNQ